MSFLVNLLTAKQLEMLHDAVPKAAAVGFLVNPGNPNAVADTAEVRRAAGTLGLALRVASVTAEDAIEKALATLVQEQARALLIGADPLFGAHRERLATLAERYALPAIFNTRDFVHAGGLMSYGPDQTDAYRQAGAYAGRILKGEKPADLPVVQSTKFDWCKAHPATAPAGSNRSSHGGYGARSSDCSAARRRPGPWWRGRSSRPSR